MIGTGPFAVSEAFIWSVALGIAGITGQYIISKKSSKGYIVGMGTQILWLTFAVQTKQYGFILLSAMYFGIYWSAWEQWRKDEKVAKAKADHSATPIRHKDAQVGG